MNLLFLILQMAVLGLKISEDKWLRADLCV